MGHRLCAKLKAGGTALCPGEHSHHIPRTAVIHRGAETLTGAPKEKKSLGGWREGSGRRVGEDGRPGSRPEGSPGPVSAGVRSSLQGGSPFVAQAASAKSGQAE